jgi:protein O-mannosyl-transferase
VLVLQQIIEMSITKGSGNPAKKQTGPKRLSADDPLTSMLDQLRGARAVLLIGLLAVLAYSNSLGGEFVFDDTDQIVENRNVRSWDNLAKAFTTNVWAFRERGGTLDAPPPLPYYRPLFTVMLTVEYHLFGLWPQGWHLVSLLLHILCVIGVFYVILLSSGRYLVALLASVLFAVHPAHAESVAWISGMTDPLFGIFFLASLYLYLKARGSNNPRAGSARRVFALSLVMFALAAFAKETALSLILLIFAYEFISASGPKASRLISSIRNTLPYAGVALIYLVARYAVLGELMWRNPQAPNRPLAYTILTLPIVICSYAGHLLWPIGLSVAYNTHFVTAITSPEFLVPVTLLALIAIGLWIYRAKISRDVWQSLALIFIPLLPVLNLGQVSREEYLLFDHYLYLPVAGLGYLIAMGITKLGAFESSPGHSSVFGLRRPAIAVGLFVAIALGSTFAAARENKSWADSYSLWSNAARVRPTYWAASYNAGLALLNAKRFDEARASLERASALKPDEADVLDGLGRAYDGMGDTANAVSSFKRAIEINPDIFESYNNLGAIYFKNANYELAEANFAQALRLKPEATASRFNLGLCYARQRRYSDATRELERVIQAMPDDAEAFYELGLTYEHMGRRDDAARAFSNGQRVAKTPQLVDKMAESLTRLQKAGAER